MFNLKNQFLIKLLLTKVSENGTKHIKLIQKLGSSLFDANKITLIDNQGHAVRKRYALKL